MKTNIGHRALLPTENATLVDQLLQQNGERMIKAAAHVRAIVQENEELASERDEHLRYRQLTKVASVAQQYGIIRPENFLEFVEGHMDRGTNPDALMQSIRGSQSPSAVKTSAHRQEDVTPKPSSGISPTAETALREYNDLFN